MNPIFSYLTVMLFLFSMPLFAATFTSPNGLVEECKILPHIPGGKYEDDDLEDEELLCSIDFYDTTKIALCPKTWSTSPGTMVYDISKTNLSQSEYEAQKSCGGSKTGHEKITKFKQTMNASGTSGTFSPAGLLYYHFSRYFDASVKVPVAVYRTMDREAHFSRVTEKAHVKGLGKGTKVKNGWKVLYTAEKEAGSYRPPEELFTDNLRQVFGFLGDGGGERYDAEINGVRSSWGDKQNEEFQETPAFLALRSEKPFAEAIQEGLTLAVKNRDVRKELGPGASPFQMAVWMKELSDIVVLDYIFNQQDRVGNIDFKWYVYYTDDKGKVKSDKLDTDTPRSRMDRIDYPRKGNPGVELIQRTRINDNDAGGKPEYTNFTKKTKMLEKLRHFSAETYAKLVGLDRDFSSGGPALEYLKANFNLSEKQVQKIVENTTEAAALLKATCKAGKMRFDLVSVKKAFKGSPTEVQVDCENPL